MTSGEVRLESGAKNKIGTPNLLLQNTDTKFYDSDRYHLASGSNGDFSNRSPQTQRKASALKAVPKHLRRKTESCVGFNQTQSGQFNILGEALLQANKALDRNKSLRKNSVHMASRNDSHMSLRETVLMGSKKDNRIGGVDGYEL